MAELVEMSPPFLSSMFGECSYMAPGDFALNDENACKQSLGESAISFNASIDSTNHRTTEFFCQQPHWQMNRSILSPNVYMKHGLSDNTTNYIVVIDKRHPRTLHIKRRIAACFSAAAPADRQDPFMLHCLVAQEIFLDGQSVITPLEADLYTQLELVDEYISKLEHRRQKEDLERMTVQLHYISRMIDPLIANADMTGMIIRSRQASHNRYCDSRPGASLLDATTKTSDALRYLLESAESQKRWLLSYKSRKDATLNLVSLLLCQILLATAAAELSFRRFSTSLHSRMR
jgi:hypothetical protein